MEKFSLTPPLARRFFYVSRQLFLLGKRVVRKEKPKSLQWLLRDLFKVLKKKYPHGHTEYLIEKGMPHVKFPLVALPLMTTNKGKRIEFSFCLHPDPEGDNAYITMGIFPMERESGAVLEEIQAGNMEGALRGSITYENVIMRWQGKRKICLEEQQYDYVISLVWKEISELTASGNYLLKRKIPENSIAILPDFINEQFNFFVHNPELPLPKMMTNSIPLS